MRRYPTRDEIIEQEDDRRWLKEVTKETQPMSDTLQEQLAAAKKLGFCEECLGYDHAPWCSAYREKNMSKNDYQRYQFPIGATVEAVIPIGRDIPVGTRGKVTSHCDDGRAWVFFDGFEEGHTFYEIEKYLRVVQLPVEQWCECSHSLYNHGEDDFSSQDCRVNGCDCDNFTLATTTHQPAARGGGDETPERIWLTRKYGDRIWKPKAGVEAELQEYIRMDQHQSLVAERDELRRVMRIIRDSYWSENEPYSDRVEYLQGMAKAALQQRSTSE